MSTYAENRRICDANEPYVAEEIISISLSTTALIFGVVLGIIFMSKMRRMKKLHNLLKLIIIITVICQILYTLSATSIPVLCHNINENVSMIGMTCSLLFYFIMMCALLGTLIIRLHLTFRHSIYKIPFIKQFILMIFFILTMCSFITAVGLYLSCVIQWDQLDTESESGDNEIQSRIKWVIYFAMIAWSQYIITAAFAVFLFAQNMLKLTKKRASTMRNIMNPQRDINLQNETELNKSQSKYINNTSRYVSLFTWALISSFVTMLSPMVANYIPSVFDGRFIYLILISGSIDGTINVICLLLQYSFCNPFYYKYCKWMECCWKRIFIRRAHKALMNKYRQQLAVVIPSRSTANQSTNEHQNNLEMVITSSDDDMRIDNGNKDDVKESDEIPQKQKLVPVVSDTVDTPETSSKSEPSCDIIEKDGQDGPERRVDSDIVIWNKPMNWHAQSTAL